MADISKRVEKAKKYLLKGKAQEALEEYLCAYKEDPSNDALIDIIAELYLKQNEPQRAMECYGYLFDKNVERHNGPGAVLVYRKMVRLGFKDMNRLFLCAGFLEKDKPQEARESYRTCLQHFEERGEKARAVDALGRLARLEPTNADLPAHMGRLTEAMGYPDQAAQHYLRAAKAGESQKALEWLLRAHELAPGDHEIGGLLGASLFAAGRGSDAASVLEPVSPTVFPDRNRLLASCYAQTGRLERAEELYWNLFERSPESIDSLLDLAERYIAGGALDRALMMLPRLKTEMYGRDKDKQFQAWIEKIRKARPTLAGVPARASVPALRFVAAACKEMNLESRRGEVNAELFDTALEAGDDTQAAAALEVLADIEGEAPLNPGRLERLRGKVSDARFQALNTQINGNRQTAAAGAGGLDFGLGLRHGSDPQPDEGGELDSELLQVELLLQFSGKEAAADYLRNLLPAHAGEERNNTRLRDLMIETGLLSHQDAAAAASVAPVQEAAAPADSFADFRRITDINRGIHRQTGLKEVLSLVVNEIGKGWNTSRCLAGLCTPGKPPTAALEYCAAGVRRSDPGSVLQLITTLTQATAGGQPLVADAAASNAALATISRVLQVLGVSSLLALPLIDGGQQTGVILLEQCGTERRWNNSEVDGLATIAEQVVLAMRQLKLSSLVSAVADEGSGLLSRSSYLDCLLRECEKAQKLHTPLSAALIEITLADGTTPAHGESERIMREAAETLLSQLQPGEIGVRYDAGALAVVFSATRAASAVPRIEKIRRLTAAICTGGDQSLRVTYGLAEAAPRNGIDAADVVTEWINRLERALEVARRSRLRSAELPLPKW